MKQKTRIDWMITLVPMVLIVILSVLFFVAPRFSNDILGQIRFFFGDTLGIYYLIIGLGIFLASLYFAFSKAGDIVLGKKGAKPKYSFFTWGSMMFTCGLAADILFYSFSEWLMYADNPHLSELGKAEEWVGVFPIFHWSLIPWGFYLVLAVAFGYMLHVRRKKRQRFSEACRPLLGKHSDGFIGRFIDLLATFALLAGTATTFSVATPLMSSILQELFSLSVSRNTLTIFIILLTCAVYTYSLLKGFKGIGLLAKACIYLFFGTLIYVLLFGGQGQFILEYGFQSLGKVIQNFFALASFSDPARTSHFPQDWTIYYWAYWMVWCVAPPFFIGKISEGRTVRQTILGGYLFGVGSTIVSFVVLGNYSLSQQLSGSYDYLALVRSGEAIYTTILSIIKTLPLAPLVLFVIFITMVAFYATSFDSIAYTAACYSYHHLEEGEHPHRSIQLLWCILLILLPIALIFSESSMSNLQSVSIVAAFPIGFVMVFIILGFLKEITHRES